MTRFDRIDDYDAHRELIFEFLVQEMTFTHVTLTIILHGAAKRLRVLGV